MYSYTRCYKRTPFLQVTSLIYWNMNHFPGWKGLFRQSNVIRDMEHIIVQDDFPVLKKLNSWCLKLSSSWNSLSGHMTQTAVLYGTGGISCRLEIVWSLTWNFIENHEICLSMIEKPDLRKLRTFTVNSRTLQLYKL